jgi:hypothetical protein
MPVVLEVRSGQLQKNIPRAVDFWYNSSYKKPVRAVSIFHSELLRTKGEES